MKNNLNIFKKSNYMIKYKANEFIEFSFFFDLTNY